MKRIAVVTGANRGIGLEVSRELAAQGVHVVLTSRSEAKGRAAAEGLASRGLPVEHYPLDVTRPESIRRLREELERRFGRLDILVNNAGVFLEDSESRGGASPSIFEADIEAIRETLETNTLGALQVSRQLIPLMRKNGSGRVVNLSSGMGQLSEMNGGYPGYRMSKTALNAVTRIFADELKGTDILVNSVCPGWVKTDMGGEGAELSVEEGADTVVWLATLPAGGPSGGFFRKRKPIPW